MNKNSARWVGGFAAAAAVACLGLTMLIFNAAANSSTGLMGVPNITSVLNGGEWMAVLVLAGLMYLCLTAFAHSLDRTKSGGPLLFLAAWGTTTLTTAFSCGIGGMVTGLTLGSQAAADLHSDSDLIGGAVIGLGVVFFTIGASIGLMLGPITAITATVAGAIAATQNRPQPAPWPAVPDPRVASPMPIPHQRPHPQAPGQYPYGPR